jgi:hypothetical protein
MNITIKEIIENALKYPDLVSALSYASTIDTETAVKQALTNTKNNTVANIDTGAKWETCSNYIFKEVAKEWGKHKSSGCTELLKYVAELDCQLDSLIWWDTKLNFYITCSAVFYSATADFQPIEDKNLVELKKAVDECRKLMCIDNYDSKQFGFLLYCSRARNKKVMPHVIKTFPLSIQHLFNEVGN